MKFRRLCEYFQKIEKTAARNEITAILADLVKEASVDEIGKITYLSLGRLAPIFAPVEFFLAAKMMVRILAQASSVSEEKVMALYKKTGDLSAVVEELFSSAGRRMGRGEGLTVADVYQSLLGIAEASGTGSQARKTDLFVRLLKQLDSLSAYYLVRIPLGRLRLGFSELTLLDALSWSKTGDKSLREDIEAAYNVQPDIGLISQIFKRDGLTGLKKTGAKVGFPILPARCQRLNTAEEIMEKMGAKAAAAEPKFDGSRAQVHLGVKKKKIEVAQEVLALEGLAKDKQLPVKIFSRNLEEMTPMFPDLALAATKYIKAQSAILDGEALGFDPKTGKFLPFQETIQRKRKYRVKEMMGQIPLQLFVFDLLALDGESLLGRPFSERRHLLEGIVKENETIKLTPQTIVTSAKQLQKLFDEAIKKGLEGLVVKNLAGEYQAGARGFNWVKFKGEMDTIDVVVLGYYFGRGKRNKFGIGAFLAGVHDEDDSYKTIAKIGTGLSDEQWVEMRQRCNKIAVKTPPKDVVVDKILTPDVWVQPKIVVTIKADAITRSPLHTAGKTDKESGLALRFPRLVDFREDKAPEDSTQVSEIEEMFELQR